MNRISLPDRRTGRGRGKAADHDSPAAKRGNGRTAGRDDVDMSNGDPDYVMLWGTDNTDPRARSDSRR